MSETYIVIVLVPTGLPCSADRPLGSRCGANSVTRTTTGRHHKPPSKLYRPLPKASELHDHGESLPASHPRKWSRISMDGRWSTDARHERFLGAPRVPDGPPPTAGLAPRAPRVEWLARAPGLRRTVAVGSLDGTQSVVTTTLPRARPSPTYRNASGTSLSPNVRSMWMAMSPATQRSVNGVKYIGPWGTTSSPRRRRVRPPMIEPIVMIANRVRTGPPTHQYRPRGASARRHANTERWATRSRTRS